MSQAGIITLLTDFGLADHYVGVMKGVILRLNPGVQLVDLCHQVPPQNVAAGAFLLQTSWAYFPSGTIHLAVVDPGVGTSRRLLAAQAGGHYFLGPDNGLLSWIFFEQPPELLVSLENPRYWLPQLSTTFHGRDILAPVAAHLSLGIPLTAFGPTIQTWQQLPRSLPSVAENYLQGEIIYVDHFGNLVTNIAAVTLEHWRRGRPVRIRIGGREVSRFGSSYQAAPPGEPLALIGSHGYLEIAVNQGQAARQLAAGQGTQVTIIFRD